MVRLPAFDIYLELGLDTSADRAQIRAAYRQAAKEAHPDVSDLSGSPASTWFRTYRRRWARASKVIVSLVSMGSRVTKSLSP